MAMQITGNAKQNAQGDAPAVAIIGPFGPPQLACLRSWKARGLRVAFVHTDARRLGGYAQRQFDHYLYAGEAGDLDMAALAKVSGYLAGLGVVGLVCIAEALALKLWVHRKLFPARMTFLLNSPDTLVRLGSKAIQIESAQASGFNVLPTWLLRAGQTDGLEQLPYPIVLRPDRQENVRPLFKVELVNSADETVRFLRHLETGSGAVVAQQYVAGPSVVIHGSRNRDGADGGFYEYVVDVKYQGVSATIRPVPLSPETETACRAFAERENLAGVFHFDLVLDEHGTEWFLEVNGRMGGTTAKAYASGLDEPASLLSSFGLIENGSAEGGAFRKPVVSRIAVTKCLLSVFRGTAKTIDYPYPNVKLLLHSALGSFLTWRDEVISLKHFRTSISYLFQNR